MLKNIVGVGFGLFVTFLCFGSCWLANEKSKGKRGIIKPGIIRQNTTKYLPGEHIPTGKRGREDTYPGIETIEERARRMGKRTRRERGYRGD